LNVKNVRNVREVNHVNIRKIKIVVDVEDIFAPELTVEDFKALYAVNPEPPRYRIINIEVVTCPEDNQPTLVTECGKCPKFIRRYGNTIACWKTSL